MDALTTIRVTHDWRGKKGRHHAAAPLISYVHVNEETGMVEFRLDASVENMVRSPEIYQRLNIRMQNVFSTAWQLTLFEIALQALASPAKRTVTLGWEEWSCLLSGKPQPLSAFSSFNRTLKTTMAQVNKLQSQVEVSVHYEMQGTEPGKRGKKAVQALYFTVQLPQQAMFSTIEESAGSLQVLIKEMATIGVAKQDAEDYLSAYGSDYISAQLAYVKSQRNVRNKLAYFISSMKENYATYVSMGTVAEHRNKIAKAVSGSSVPALPQPQSGAAGFRISPPAGGPGRDDAATPKEKPGAGLAAALEKGRKLWESEQRLKALNGYDALSEEEQAKIWKDFQSWAGEHKNKFVRDAIQKGGRSSKIAMTELGEFLVFGAHPFEAPSDQEILDFMFKGGHLTV